ncbi:syntaxin of plants 71 [Actinidia rufa]|uniref:Syntaxin of plants 71 n=1 Tax=Actinidia rufa TaxID=165716 RepID=A0A7J0GKX9_9ERIC|nr:syntaxin of plants 71 [Actinidia rufa]
MAAVKMMGGWDSKNIFVDLGTKSHWAGFCVDNAFYLQVRGLSTEEFAVRNGLVLALPDRIQAIPDGTAGAPKQPGGWTALASRTEIKFNFSLTVNTSSKQKESSQFRQEYEMRKMKQAREGLDTLKNMAHDMNEEMDRQVPLMDEINTKVDKATSDLKNTNVRLKDTVNQLRSSRNFCIDIILLCIILGIAAYLYKNLAKWWRISLRTANRRFFLGSSSETRPDLVGNSPRSRRKRAPNSQSPTGAMAVRDLLGNLPDEARFDTDEGRFDFERLPLCSVTRQQASPVLR